MRGNSRTIVSDDQCQIQPLPFFAPAEAALGRPLQDVDSFFFTLLSLDSPLLRHKVSPIFLGSSIGAAWFYKRACSFADAATLGISATPSFVIGKTTKDSMDGDRVVGAVPVSVFEGEIQKFMAAK